MLTAGWHFPEAWERGKSLRLLPRSGFIPQPRTSSEASTAIKITERFLSLEIDQLNDDVVDCIGEVVNMLAGNAKAQLEGYELSLSLPSIVRGADHLIEFPRAVVPICIPFSSEIGDVMEQVGFVIRE